VPLPRSIASLVLLTVAAACTSGASPAASPSASATAASTLPTATPTGSPAASVSLPADLGPAPTIQYPESQTLGIATITLARPVDATAHFWVACEWSSTETVASVYSEPATLLGETIHPGALTVGEPAFWFDRDGQVAGYWPDATTVETRTVTRGDATVTFTGLPLNPERWEPGPLPTPKASFERPLGGDPDAIRVDGSVQWACGTPPATVPEPTPSQSEEPLPSLLFDRMPSATIHVGDEAHRGTPGCGASWEGYGSSGGDSCGPSYEVIGDGDAVHGSAGDRLRFSLPAGFHFTSWSLQWIDQATAAYYRGLEPPDMRSRPGETGIADRALSLPGLPVGDWSVRLVWSGTDGNLTLSGRPDYFRVVIG
jgi:hypothetical protein